MKKIILLFLLVGIFSFSYGAEKILNEEENAINYTNIYKINENGEMINSEIVEDIFENILQYVVKETKTGKTFNESVSEISNNVYYKVEKWEKQNNGLFYAKKIIAYNMLEYNLNTQKSNSNWYKNSKWKYSPGDYIYKREYDVNGHGARVSITEKNKLSSEDVEKLQFFIGNSNFAETILFIIPLVKDKNDKILQFGMAEMY